MRGVQSRAQYTERFDWDDTHATPLPRSRRKMGSGLIVLTVRKIGSHTDQRVAHVRLVPPLQFDGISSRDWRPGVRAAIGIWPRLVGYTSVKKFEGDFSRDVRGYPLTIYTEKSLYSSRLRKTSREWSVSFLGTCFRLIHG